MKKRSLDYENKFKKYLFSFDFETHKEICNEINVKWRGVKMNKKELFKSVKTLIKNNQLLTKELDKQINKVLDSGYVEIENYDFKEYGYQLPKLVLHLALKKLYEDTKPLDTQFMKQYKSLIRSY